MAGRLLLALLLLSMAGTPGAQEVRQQRARIDPAVLTEGFLAAHPDLRWRREGIFAYEAGEHATAFRYFLRAARYADKASQAMVADMYWSGTGIAADRALAYAWMDLAAERMYADFVAHRERLWQSMDDVERADAVARGQQVYAEYGDHVAKPRLETVMRRARKNVTGSRLGFVGYLTIVPNSGLLGGSGVSLSGEDYYAPRYWQPDAYWRLQDEIWRAPPRGRVRVGEVEQAVEPAPSGHDD